MIIKLRIVLFSLFWLLKLRKIRSVWKKYTKKKVEFAPEYRNNLILKYSKFILKLFRLKIKVFGYENLPKTAAVIISNHNSFADYFVLCSALENPEKGEGQTNPISTFLLEKQYFNRKNKWIFGILDSLFLTEDPKKNIAELGSFLKTAREKRIYGIVFSKKNEKKSNFDFPVNVFNATKQTGLAIIPVSINFSDENSYKLNRKKVQNIEIFFHKPIKTAAVFAQTSKSLFLTTKKAIFQNNGGDK
ncbi:lysophospholipid acyltransferase family protein [Mesomycoplasma hyopneumoniae]|uniref:lysophospholipid acyltransferase family protein n=1 Tax=Mesomycoplasma hyopneumoniae TaxID=2099 RepID=UPI003857CFF5